MSAARASRTAVRPGVYRRLSELLYLKTHPYSWPTIGSMEDLTAASSEDVAEFFKTYYAPNNASLVIAGDIDRAARGLVEKWFDEIPRGPAVPPMAPPASALTRVKKQTLTDRVQLPRLDLAWHTPACSRAWRHRDGYRCRPADGRQERAPLQAARLRPADRQDVSASSSRRHWAASL